MNHILEHTRDLWRGMRNQRLFITGGTGFFGAWLLESFCSANTALNLGSQAVVLTRDPTAYLERMPHVAANPSVKLHRGDVRDFVYPDGDFSFVIHAANEASARQAAEAPREMLTTILGGTQRTLDFALSHGTTHYLLTSSGAVYGSQPAGLRHVPETYAGAPDVFDVRSVYAEGKRAAEMMCAVYSKAKSLQCKIARCWAFCGPHLPLDTHFAIGNFIGDALAGRPLRIEGDGTTRRSYLYASDLTIWLWTILFQAPPLMPINVGSDEDRSILELAETVITTLGVKVEIEVGQQPTSEALPSRYVPDIQRAREMLGLSPKVSLCEAIRKTAEWHGRSSTK